MNVLQADYTDIAQVQTFVEAKERLEQFMADNTDLMTEYQRLVEEHNCALADADNVMRDLVLSENAGISCGPFKFKCFQSRVDIDRALEVLGDEGLIQCGATKQTVVEYRLEGKKVEQALANGTINKDQAELFFKRIAMFNKPKPITVGG